MGSTGPLITDPRYSLLMLILHSRGLYGATFNAVAAKLADRGVAVAQLSEAHADVAAPSTELMTATAFAAEWYTANRAWIYDDDALWTRLVDIERELAVPTILRAYHIERVANYFARRGVVPIKRREWLTRICMYRDLVADMIDRWHPDVFLSEPLTGMFHYVAYHMLQRAGARYVAISPSRVVNNHFVMTSRAEGDFPDIELRLRSVENPQAEAQALLARMRSGSITQGKAQAVGKVSNPPITRRLATAARLIRQPANPFALSVADNVRRVGQLYLNRWVAGTTSTFEKAAVPNPYLVYFLQFEPEVSTLQWSYEHPDQIAFIEGIARRLPARYRLAVKEHPHHRGYRATTDYRRLRALPNVQVLDPAVPSAPLLRGSSGVVTLTGTVGFEGLVLGKPVHAVGHAFYTGFPGVFRDFEAFLKAVDNGSPPLDDEALTAAIADIAARSYPGLADPITPGFRDEENIIALAAAFAQLQKGAE